MSPSYPTSTPIILFLGEDVQHNHDIYDRLKRQFDIRRPPAAHRQRPEFLQHLRDRKWGNFSAIMRPSWHTGGEMGRWDREVIELLPSSVKVSASAGAGYDWVDTECLAEHGILYCNGAGASTEAVADMALYYLISVFRNMTWSALAARSTDPKKFLLAHHSSPETAHNPRSHTLGIMGLGNIGYAIAKKAFAAFGMRILYNDIVRKRLEVEESVRGEFFRNVEDMLPKCDCLLLATPGNFDSRPFLTRSVISLLPKGARFINIARGSLVDEDALADALESGHLSAAGLDVHADEPRVSERLAEMWNVTMTCHTGGGVVETGVGFERLAMENVEAVLLGGTALTPVNAHLIQERGMNGHHDHDTKGANGNGNGVVRMNE